jgi:hypothetical protein
MAILWLLPSCMVGQAIEQAGPYFAHLVEGRVGRLHFHLEGWNFPEWNLPPAAGQSAIARQASN